MARFEARVERNSPPVAKKRNEEASHSGDKMMVYNLFGGYLGYAHYSKSGNDLYLTQAHTQG